MGKHVNEERFCVCTGFWWKLALPEVILPLHLSVFLAACAWAASRPAGRWDSVVIGVSLGFFVWTLFEYAFHRWLLHHTTHPVLRRIFWNGFHREHHSCPHMKDPDHHGIHVAISLPINLLLIGAVGLASESPWGSTNSAGWILGYCLYWALHWLFHSVDPGNRFARFRAIHTLGDAHTVPHLHPANRNYGLTTMFWGKVFGTYLRLDEI